MSKNKSVKYKITDTDISKDIAKKIVGKQVTVEKVKVNDGFGSDGGRKPPKQRKAPAWFIEFNDEQREFNKSIMQRFDEQSKFNKQQLKFNTRIEKEVLNLGDRFDRVIKINNLKK